MFVKHKSTFIHSNLTLYLHSQGISYTYQLRIIERPSHSTFAYKVDIDEPYCPLVLFSPIMIHFIEHPVCMQRQTNTIPRDGWSIKQAILAGNGPRVQITLSICFIKVSSQFLKHALIPFCEIENGRRKPDFLRPSYSLTVSYLYFLWLIQHYSQTRVYSLSFLMVWTALANG